MGALLLRLASDGCSSLSAMLRLSDYSVAEMEEGIGGSSSRQPQEDEEEGDNVSSRSSSTRTLNQLAPSPLAVNLITQALQRSQHAAGHSLSCMSRRILQAADAPAVVVIVTGSLTAAAAAAAPGLSPHRH